MASISLRQVVKRYGTGPKANPVIHGVDAEIADGEFIVIVGPSGCGKSTLLRMVAGLEEISGGEIAIGGRVVNQLEPAERDIAMVFQNYALYPHMTVYDNMAYGLKIAKRPKDEIEQRVQKAARILGCCASGIVGCEHLGDREARIGGGIRGVECDSTRKCGDGELEALSRLSTVVLRAEQELVVGLAVRGPMGFGERLGGQQLHLQRVDDRGGDLVLQLEDVRDLAVVGLRPQVRTVGRPDQLGGDPERVAGFPDTALEHVVDAERLRDRRDVGVLVLERERRGPRDHPELRQLREQVQQLLGQAVGKVLLVARLAHVLERQHGDRRSRCRGRPRRRWRHGR